MKCLQYIPALALLLLCPGLQGATLKLDRLLEPYEGRKTEQVLENNDAKEVAAERAVQSNSETLRITKEDAVAALLEAGRASIGESDSLEIEIKSGWEPTSVASDRDWKLRVVERFAPDARGRWFPSVVLEVDGIVQERWRLKCDVDLYRLVYLTTQRLGRGETPMRPGIRPVICNIYDEPTRPVPVTEDLDNYEMLKTLSVGQFLTWEDIQPRRAVRKGETVDVTLKKGRLSINMQAMCMQDGLVEETVRLKNPKTRVEFAGVVIAPGKVRVTQ